MIPQKLKASSLNLSSGEIHKKSANFTAILFLTIWIGS